MRSGGREWGGVQGGVGRGGWRGGSGGALGVRMWWVGGTKSLPRYSPIRDPLTRPLAFRTLPPPTCLCPSSNPSRAQPPPTPRTALAPRRPMTQQRSPSELPLTRTPPTWTAMGVISSPLHPLTHPALYFLGARQRRLARRENCTDVTGMPDSHGAHPTADPNDGGELSARIELFSSAVVTTGFFQNRRGSSASGPIFAADRRPMPVYSPRRFATLLSRHAGSHSPPTSITCVPPETQYAVRRSSLKATANYLRLQKSFLAPAWRQGFLPAQAMNLGGKSRAPALVRIAARHIRLPFSSCNCFMPPGTVIIMLWDG